MTTPQRHADDQCNDVRVSFGSSCRNKLNSRPKDKAVQFS